MILSNDIVVSSTSGYHAMAYATSTCCMSDSMYLLINIFWLATCGRLVSEINIFIDIRKVKLTLINDLWYISRLLIL